MAAPSRLPASAPVEASASGVRLRPCPSAAGRGLVPWPVSLEIRNIAGVPFTITGAKGVARVPGPARMMKPDTIWEEHLLAGDTPMQNLREPIDDQAGGVITALGLTIEARRTFSGYR